MQKTSSETRTSEARNSKQGRHTAKHTAKKNNRSRAPRIAITVLAAVIIVLSALAVYINGYSNVYPNTFIEDINIGGKTRIEVMDILTARYSADIITGRSLMLICNDNTLELSAAELDASFDNVALTEKAMASGRDGNIFTNTAAFLSRFINKEVINPVVIYNADALTNALNTVTADYEVEPVGHTFVIEPNLVTIHGPVNGVKADRAAATEAVERQIYSGKFGDVVLNPVGITPEALNFDEFYNWLTSDAQDASYEKVDGKVVVKPSKFKCDIDRQAVSDALEALKTSADNTVKLSVVTTTPAKTTEALTENLYKDVLGKYSTNYGSSSAARANNVRLATSRIDGIELMPGEEFSYDKTILPRTAANGYMAAGVYVGNKSEIGMGGGICQPSSTLYAATLYANLEIVERHNHSLPVSYLPLGMDATIAEGVLDFRFSNSTEYPIKISASSGGGIVTFSILGYNPDNISVDIERSFSGGAYYVTRVVKENGVEIKREQMTSSRYGTPEKDEPETAPETENPEEAEQAPTDSPEAAPPVSEGTAPSESAPTPAPTPAPAPAPTPEPTPTPTPAPAPTAPVEPSAPGNTAPSISE